MGSLNNTDYTGHRITQIGIIVEELEAAVENYRSTFGWGPWRVYDLVPPLHRNITLQGKEVDGGIRVALADAGGLDIELIQPLWGPSQHAEFLAEHGPGINHILVRRYESGQEVILDAAGLGMAELMSADFGPVHYSYLDGRDNLHTLIEVTEGSTATSGMVPDRTIPA